MCKHASAKFEGCSYSSPVQLPSTANDISTSTIVRTIKVRSQAPAIVRYTCVRQGIIFHAVHGKRGKRRQEEMLRQGNDDADPVQIFWSWFRQSKRKAVRLTGHQPPPKLSLVENPQAGDDEIGRHTTTQPSRACAPLHDNAAPSCRVHHERILVGTTAAHVDTAAPD